MDSTRDKRRKKRKSWSTQFSNHAHILPRITNLPLRTFSNYPRSKTFESHFSHISPVKIRRKRRNRDYSLGKTNVEARSNEWAKGSKGIRIILLERQGSNPLSVHRASLPFLPFRGRGKKLNGAVPWKAPVAILGPRKADFYPPSSPVTCCFRAIEISRGADDHRWGTEIGNGTRWTLVRRRRSTAGQKFTAKRG